MAKQETLERFSRDEFDTIIFAVGKRKQENFRISLMYMVIALISYVEIIRRNEEKSALID